ncbi:hypothetical protein DL93DRAFT_1161416 [Clavulina sp. PMI_390]|nr:hypothetical protein DL93DRAFT_1161416 [Clavulina sp. PMI_390]
MRSLAIHYGVPTHPLHNRSAMTTILAEWFIGILLNSFWTGVIQVQSYLLFRKFPKDPYYLKLIVLTLCVSQMFYFFSCLLILYNDLVRAAMDITLLSASIWEMRWVSTHRLITTTLSQLFFAGRLWSYGRDLRVILPLAIVIMTTTAFGIAESDKTWHLEYTGSLSLFYWSQTAWNISIVATDLFISLYLLCLMLRRRSGFKSTNSILNLIIIYGVTTGVVSSVLALIGLVSNEVDCLCKSSFAKHFARPHTPGSKHSTTKLFSSSRCLTARRAPSRNSYTPPVLQRHCILST